MASVSPESNFLEWAKSCDVEAIQSASGQRSKWNNKKALNWVQSKLNDINNFDNVTPKVIDNLKKQCYLLHHSGLGLEEPNYLVVNRVADAYKNALTGTGNTYNKIFKMLDAAALVKIAELTEKENLSANELENLSQLLSTIEKFEFPPGIIAAVQDKLKIEVSKLEGQDSKQVKQLTKKLNSSNPTPTSLANIASTLSKLK